MTYETAREVSEMLQKSEANILRNQLANAHDTVHRMEIEMDGLRMRVANVTAERDALQAKLDAVPMEAIVNVFNAADNDGYYNDDVAEWLMENGVKL